MTISFLVNPTAVGGAAGATTAGIDTTGADFFALVASWYSGVSTNVTISDSKSNTWNGLTQSTSSGPFKCQIFWCKPTSVGAGHTFTVSAASSFSSISVAAFAGVTTSPADQQNGATVGSGGATISTGSVTPSENNELLIAGLVWGDNAATISVSGGFTIPTNGTKNWTTSTNEGCSLAYLIQTTAIAANPQWTASSNFSVAAAARIATFKAAATGGGGNPWYYRAQEAIAA